MRGLSNFLANRKTPGLELDQLNLFEDKPIPTGLALLVPVDQLDEDPDNPRKEYLLVPHEQVTEDKTLKDFLSFAKSARK